MFICVGITYIYCIGFPKDQIVFCLTSLSFGKFYWKALNASAFVQCSHHHCDSTDKMQGPQRMQYWS